MERLTLIGMPGSGKSAVGETIARRLGWEFLDTDRCIEKEHGMALQELIDRVGDAAFRLIEEKGVLNLALPERCVISTGGSVVYSEKAMRRLAALSTVVFLDVDLEVLRTRIESEAPRGIVGMTEGGLEELYLERLPYYRRYAALTVNVSNETLEEAAARVLSELSG